MKFLLTSPFSSSLSSKFGFLQAELRMFSKESFSACEVLYFNGIVHANLPTLSITTKINL